MNSAGFGDYADYSINRKSQKEKDAIRDRFRYLRCTVEERAVLDKFYKGSYLTQQSYKDICWDSWMSATEYAFLQATLTSMATDSSFCPSTETLIRLGLFKDAEVCNACSPRLLNVIYRPDIFLFALTQSRYGPLLNREEMVRLHYSAIYGPDYNELNYNKYTNFIHHFYNFDRRRHRASVTLSKLDCVLLEFATQLGETEFLALYKAQVEYAEARGPLPSGWDIAHIPSSSDAYQADKMEIAYFSFVSTPLTDKWDKWDISHIPLTSTPLTDKWDKWDISHIPLTSTPLGDISIPWPNTPPLGDISIPWPSTSIAPDTIMHCHIEDTQQALRLALAQRFQRYLPKRLMMQTRISHDMDTPSDMVDGSLYRQAFPRSCTLL